MKSFDVVMIEEVDLRAGGTDNGMQSEKFQEGPGAAFLHADYQRGRQLSARCRALVL